MSFTITHTCGHDSQVRKMKDDWKANGICPDCYIEQQNSNVKAVSASDDLPALEGSEAQVNWAMKIRLDWIKDIRRNGVKHAEAVAMAALETSAKFWIEHRSLFVKILGILDTRLDEIEAVAAPVEAATQVAEKAPTKQPPPPSGGGYPKERGHTMETYTIAEEIQSALATEMAAVSHEAYCADAQGHWYAVDEDGDGVLETLHCVEATRQFNPWPDSAVAIPIEDCFLDEDDGYDLRWNCDCAECPEDGCNGAEAAAAFCMDAMRTAVQQ